MSVKIEIILNEPVVSKLKNIKDVNQRDMAVRDVLLSSANELVPQIAREGLVKGVTITKHVGLIINGTCFEIDNTEVTTEEVT